MIAIDAKSLSSTGATSLPKEEDSLNQDADEDGILQEMPLVCNTAEPRVFSIGARHQAKQATQRWHFLKKIPLLH